MHQIQALAFTCRRCPVRGMKFAFSNAPGGQFPPFLLLLLLLPLPLFSITHHLGRPSTLLHSDSQLCLHPNQRKVLCLSLCPSPRMHLTLLIKAGIRVVQMNGIFPLTWEVPSTFPQGKMKHIAKQTLSGALPWFRCPHTRCHQARSRSPVLEPGFAPAAETSGGRGKGVSNHVLPSLNLAD